MGFYGILGIFMELNGYPLVVEHGELGIHHL
jgi:hypothetical protein